MKRFMKVVVIIALIAGAVLGGYILLQGNPSQASATTDAYQQTVTVTRGNVSSSMSVVGELAAVQQADLAFEKLSSSTKLAALAVAAGNTVKAGDVLATVNAEAYQQAVDQAKSDLAAAEQTLGDLQTATTAVAIAQADLKIAQAEYQIQEAKSTLSDLQNPDIAQLKTNAADAKTSLAKAQASLLSTQQSAKDTTAIEKLEYTEGLLTTTYNRLAAETYSDASYQDRLLIAYNKMLDAHEATVTARVQVQVNLLNAQIAVHKAEQALVDAQEALAAAQGGSDALALADAQLAVKAGEVALADAQEARAQLDVGANATDLAAAQADVDKKKLALADAEAALVGTNLTAPFDGTILQVNVNQGDLISSGATILTVADLNQLEVLASVDETTVRSVAAGQTARVTFDAQPGQTLNGVVGEAPLQGTLQGDVMVYEVPITLAGVEKLPLLVGMTANVTISTGEAADVLVVPTMALTKSNGLYQVLVADAAKPDADPQAVPVQIGLSDGTYTQITAGLNEGDQVVVEMTGATSSSSNDRGGGLFGGGGIMGMFGGR